MNIFMNEQNSNVKEVKKLQICQGVMLPLEKGKKAIVSVQGNVLSTTMVQDFSVTTREITIETLNTVYRCNLA